MAKNNERAWKLLRIAIIVGVLIVGIAVAYGTLKTTQGEHERRIDKVETKADANERAIVEIKTDIKYIRSAVDDNRAVQREILKEIRK